MIRHGAAATPAAAHARKVPMNNTARLFTAFEAEITDAVLSAAGSGAWLNGPRSKAFASAFAGFLQARHCLLVAERRRRGDHGRGAVGHLRVNGGHDGDELPPLAGHSAARQAGGLNLSG
jgi:hypothetical protein